MKMFNLFKFRYSKENASEQEMKNAAEKANALSFIESNEFGTFIYLKIILFNLLPRRCQS